MQKLLVLILSCCLPAFCLTNVVKAAAGDLDPTFGNGGKSITNFYGFHDTIYDAAVQPDGKTVVVGLVMPSDNVNHLAVARFRWNGTLDTTFGSDGKVVFAGLGICSLIIQPDGKIVVGGTTHSTPSVDFGLVRFHSDGTPDLSFGVGGLASMDFLGGSDELRDLAVQPDGKIVAAGLAGTGNDHRLGIARFNSDGSPDNDFGDHGKVSLAKLGSGEENLNTVEIQPDLKIVIAGHIFSAGPLGPIDFGSSRLNSDGQLDQSFGNGGRVATPIGNGSFTVGIFDVVIQPDGKIVAVGHANGTIALVRYEANGDLDASFGSGGKVITSVPRSTGSFAAKALLLQADKIVVAGAGYTATQGGRDLALLRYDLDGDLDPTFGNQGIVVNDFLRDESAETLLLAPDGKLLIAGTRAGGIPDDFLLARYLTAENDAPVLQKEVNSTQALALDSVTFLKGPFSVTNDLNFSADHRTRVVLFATNLTLANGETFSSVTVQAQASGGGTHTLPVEYVGEVRGCEWVTQVVVKLPDGLANAGTVQMSITHGNTSNQGSIVVE